MALLNPLGDNGPGWAGNYVQPDYRVPSVNANVQSYPVGANPMGLTWPIPAYVQPNFTPSTDPAALPL